MLLTVRADYFNLLSDIKDTSGQVIRDAGGQTLFERLNINGGDAILRLKRISDQGLADAVCKPLRVAGETDEAALEALLKAVKRDISDQPSDLPLLQVALRAAWQEHKATGRPMLVAYEAVGGVRGALANEAERVCNKLSPEDLARLESIFVRLVRLGDTGGATRRIASLEEFDDLRRDLLQRLGRDEYGRLVALKARSAEIALEALITQWPWLQRTLKNDASDVRRLDRLMMRSHEWSEATVATKSAHLAVGAERELLAELAEQRPDWVSLLEREFVEASNKSHEAERERKRKEFETARRNESVALTALAVIEAKMHPLNAVKLALAAWPRDNSDTTTPKLSAALDVLGQTVPYLQHASECTIATLAGHSGPVISAVFSLDGTRVVTASWDNTARLWDTGSAREVATLVGHTERLASAAFSPDGRRVVTTSEDCSARLWDAVSGREVAMLRGHTGVVISAVFSRDGTRIITASRDTTARVWDAASASVIATLWHSAPLLSATFNPDGTRLVTVSADKTRRCWDMSSGREVAKLAGHGWLLNSGAFNLDGTCVVTPGGDSTARLWDAKSGHEVATLSGHGGEVLWSAFSPDGTRIVTSSKDMTVRLWDAASGRAVASLAGHSGWVSSAAFSPDGARIVTASWDNTARVWEIGGMPKGHILQVACKLLNGNFSLNGVTTYPLVFDRPICAIDPPPPDLSEEARATLKGQH